MRWGLMVQYMTNTLPRSHQRQQSMLHTPLIARGLPPGASQLSYAVIYSLRSVNFCLVASSLRPRAPQVLWLATITSS